MNGRLPDERDDRLGAAGRELPIIFDPAAPRSIEWVADMIRDGGVVAIPTDTVYGLAAALDQPRALDRVFVVKGRRQGIPLPILLSGPDRLRDVAAAPDERLVSLGAWFWPGPLTVVLPARSGLPEHVLGRNAAGHATVGVRVPDHFLAIEVVERCGGALAVTSANQSGQPPALTAADVVATVGSGLDAVLDGGRSPGGVASSVVAFDGSRLGVLREGAVPRADIEAVWASIERGAR